MDCFFFLSCYLCNSKSDVKKAFSCSHLLPSSIFTFTFRKAQSKMLFFVYTGHYYAALDVLFLSIVTFICSTAVKCHPACFLLPQMMDQYSFPWRPTYSHAPSGWATALSPLWELEDFWFKSWKCGKWAERCGGISRALSSVISTSCFYFWLQVVNYMLSISPQPAKNSLR